MCESLPRERESVDGFDLQLCFLTSWQNWIGSEAVKRKKKAGILPRPKIELLGVSYSMISSAAECVDCCTHTHTHTGLLTLALSLTHAFIHSLSHSLTHSLTHSHTHRLPPLPRQG